MWCVVYFSILVPPPLSHSLCPLTFRYTYTNIKFSLFLMLWKELLINASIQGRVSHCIAQRSSTCGLFTVVISNQFFFFFIWMSKDSKIHFYVCSSHFYCCKRVIHDEEKLLNSKINHNIAPRHSSSFLLFGDIYKI